MKMWLMVLAAFCLMGCGNKELPVKPFSTSMIDEWFRSDIVDNPLTVSLNEGEIVFVMVLGVWNDKTGRTEKPCWVKGIIIEETETKFKIKTGIEAMNADPAYLTKETGVWRTHDKEHIPEDWKL